MRHEHQFPVYVGVELEVGVQVNFKVEISGKVTRQAGAANYYESRVCTPLIAVLDFRTCIVRR
jgi:hypothetical protein